MGSFETSRAAVRGEGTGPCLIVEIVTRHEPERTRLPHAGNRAVDDRRGDRVHVLVADPEPRCDAGAEALHEHVRVSREFERRARGPRRA